MKLFHLILLLLGLCPSLFAQKLDSIKVGTPLKDFGKLNYGTFDFEVYTEMNGQKIRTIPMTSSTTKEWIDKQEYISIQHKWSAPKFSGAFQALVQPETFQPIIQIRKTDHQGKEAYRFFTDQIVGLDSAVQNEAADYQLDLAFPVFNFEIDIETFSILPMAANKQFLVPFFHVGSETVPAYYKVIVEKSEAIEIPGKGMRDCWVLFIDYAGKQPSRFWYTKADRQFVKMEGQYGKLKIYKVRKF